MAVRSLVLLSLVAIVSVGDIAVLPAAEGRPAPSATTDLPARGGRARVRRFGAFTGSFRPTSCGPHRWSKGFGWSQV